MGHKLPRSGKVVLYDVEVGLSGFTRSVLVDIVKRQGVIAGRRISMSLKAQEVDDLIVLLEYYKRTIKE